MSETGIEIEILMFGATADAVGSRRLKRTVSTEMDVSKLVKQLKSEFPGLAKHNLLISINQEYAAAADGFHKGDEVAIFTAVSGG